MAWTFPRVGAADGPAHGCLRVPSAALPGAPREAVLRAGREPVRALLTWVSSAPVDDGPPVAACVRDPALTGFRGTGIVVSRAQGALGLLPFAVRLGGLHGRQGPPSGSSRRVAAPSREGQPSSVRHRAGPGKGDTPDRVDRTVGRDQDLKRHHEQSNTFESTTQRR